MNAPLIGQSIRRKEDARFLTGAGQYTDDVALPGQAYACILLARAAPGVVGVYTGEDLAAAKV